MKISRSTLYLQYCRLSDGAIQLAYTERRVDASEIHRFNNGRTLVARKTFGPVQVREEGIRWDFWICFVLTFESLRVRSLLVGDQANVDLFTTTLRRITIASNEYNWSHYIRQCGALPARFSVCIQKQKSGFCRRSVAVASHDGCQRGLPAANTTPLSAPSGWARLHTLMNTRWSHYLKARAKYRAPVVRLWLASGER